MCMFERFTPDARQVVVLAQEEARELNHDHIGTEHIVLGLLRGPDAVPRQVLANFGVDVASARSRVAETLGRGDQPFMGQMPFTFEGKKTLELALREALRLGNSWIESGHVLLGLLDVGPSPGFDVLVGLGVDPESARDAVITQLASTERPRPRPQGATGPSVTVAGIGGFRVGPDAQLRRVLMTAAAGALKDAREEFGIADLLQALKEASEPEESPQDEP